jgi:hypothetical protein
VPASHQTSYPYGSWSQRYLRAFPSGRVERHAADERVEGSEMIGDRRRSEAVVQSVLAERALRPIDSGKDVVEVEIRPSPLIERTAATENPDSGTV